MPRKPNPTPDDPEQSKRFIEMAREVEADGTMEDLERAFAKLTKKKPEKTKR
jgi:hypothetical protein